MQGPVFTAYRTLLGLQRTELAEILGVGERSVRAWETGRSPIPEGVAAKIEELVSVQGGLAGKMASHAGRVVMPRSGGRGFPRGFYMAALGRALEQNPGIDAAWE
ncbi:helix-turn-helix domain-containing protein [Actinotignum schaalii]|uniref:helix-turn-helix domain-containing protein n=1 Tax=Actinotignum TaxID=1653174 RepID=UPI003B97ABCE